MVSGNEEARGAQGGSWKLGPRACVRLSVTPGMRNCCARMTACGNAAGAAHSAEVDGKLTHLPSCGQLPSLKKNGAEAVRCARHIEHPFHVLWAVGVKRLPHTLLP